MKTLSRFLTRRLLRLVVLAFALGGFAAPVAHAGLTMEVDLNRQNYQGSQSYFFGCQLSTNSTPPNVSFGDYSVVSPGWPTNANASAYLFRFDTNGLNQVSGTWSGGFSLFDSTNFSDSFIQNVTNGQWTIFVTNAVATNVYYFTVTASIGSNAIPLVSIIYPPNNALNVTNQPTYLWQSPANYDEQVLYTPISGYVLPVTQQSFSGDTLTAGLNSITVDTYYLSSVGVVSSVPTNSAGSPLSGWVSTWHVWDYANVQFTVGSPADFNADLGTTNLPWGTMGDSAWFTETTNTANGAPAADQSGSVTNGQASTLAVVVTGPGTLTYYWSTIASGSFSCEFDVDGNYSNNITGNTAWYQDGPYAIGPGQHTLSWTAYANGETDPTEAGFLGSVSYVTTPAPTLAVTASPPSGTVPLTVQYTSPAVDSFGNTLTNWNWDFGDGGTSTAQSPSHIYTNAGSFFPSLTAYSTFGATPLAVTGPGTITVTNLTLNVSVTPSSGFVPLTVQFSSPAVDSGGSTVTNWSWTFGDGGTSTAQNPLHIYTGLGNFSPTLVARSTHGSTPLDVTGLGVVTVTSTPNPNFHTLYTFSPAFGSGPNGGLVLSGNTLYGTTQHGGISGYGTVFAINTSGTGFTNLFNNFNATFTNGIIPPGGVILSGGTLYGSTYGGGLKGGGTVFALGTNGLGFTNLVNFDGNVNPNSPDEPQASVVLAGNTLYGTTWYGGAYDHGTIYYVATNGSSSGILHAFYTPSYTPYANNYDGLFPSARLTYSGGTLYGTAENGGSLGGGAVFSVITNQPGSFGILHYFSTPVNGTNSDGAYSFSSLVLSGTNLYGTTFGGGSYGFGTVFSVHIDGSGFTNLYSFTGTNGAYGPHSGLTLSGNTLFGTTSGGGLLGTLSSGTLFAINTDGSGYQSLYSFSGGSDGAVPQGDLIINNNTLYGTTAGGGSGDGTLFSFTLGGPQLAIARSGTNVILTWSASALGYNLQSSTQINTSAVWSAVSPLPAVVNGLNTVTNPISSSPKFYRLSQ